ncbi:MAG TPA: ATP-dependent Clp protease proteolytic subunit [Gaiellaceae bacterium]|nr:ATP-dependent Clp protease proteolytic subunit [Gaiellaceae bacterium]
MAEIQVLFTGDVNQQSVTRLISEVTDRVGKGARSVLLALSTPGGGVHWGVTAYGLLRGLGIEVITHNVGQVDSIGGPIYAAGDRRLCTSQGRFLIHSVYWPFAVGANPSEKEVGDILIAMQRDRDRIATILSERSGTAIETVRDDMRNTRILDAGEAKDYGLVHEITDDVFDPSQEIVNISG